MLYDETNDREVALSVDCDCPVFAAPGRHQEEPEPVAEEEPCAEAPPGLDLVADGCDDTELDPPTDNEGKVADEGGDDARREPLAENKIDWPVQHDLLHLPADDSCAACQIAKLTRAPTRATRH